ncbi:uncharacterized protein [Amphiura filiformis]|uniref:uncharacterized protein n=1 Tax=Amphiura filiformis TaxID=82378 RepID=UPI003B222EA3
MDTQPSELGLRESESGLRESEPGLREYEPGVREVEPGGVSRPHPRLKLGKTHDEVKQEFEGKREGELRQDLFLIDNEDDDHDDFEEHYQSIKLERDLIKTENEFSVEDDVQVINVQEDVQMLIRNFQADFDSQKQDFEKKIREKTINETLNMVAEQNEAIQRQLTQKQVQQQENKDLAAQDMDEKLRLEREKMKEELQKEMREEMKRQMEQLMEQQKQNQPPTPEKDAIVIKPSQKGTACPYRPIVIDGSNVAMLHGKRLHTFSCRGIALCVQFFQKMGVEDITVFVPRWRQSQDAVRQDRPIRDQEILNVLESRGILSFTPSRRVRGKYINAYDDRFIVRLAAENDGIIVSNDNFRDLMNESHQWRNVIETKLLMYTFAGDQFMIPDDPYGRNGPTLKELLLKPKTAAAKKTYPVGPQTAGRQEPQPSGLSEHQIEQLTYNIGVEWERLGTYLRFSHSEITKIRRDHHQNTDGAIRKMLKTWSGRQTRNKSNQYEILSEALRLSGRADLATMVMRWKPVMQQNKGGQKQGGNQGGFGQPQGPAGQLGPGPVGPHTGLLGQHPQQGNAGLLGQQPQQVYGGRPQQRQQNAPATQSRAPDEVVDVKALPQYKVLKDMFPDKEADIVKLLQENPNSLADYLVDKLLT